MPSVKKILEPGFNFGDRLILDYKELRRIVGLLRESGYTIVMTQGVYDMYHVGHGRYLREAKTHGDVLIVGVDSDELTRSRKGPKRPFDTFTDRVEVLADNRAVDIITVRNVGDDPNLLIEVVRPDVLIVSQTTKDFPDESIEICRQWCGDIKTLEAQAATSTTAKLRRLMADGAEELGRKVTELVDSFVKGMVGDGEGKP